MDPQELIELKQQLLLLYSRQTTDEQLSMSTNWENGRGFNGPDGPFGSSIAVRILQGWEISPKVMGLVKKILCKYQNTQLADGGWRNIEVPEVVYLLGEKTRRKEPDYKLVTQGDCFVSLHSFSEKDKPKTAGFTWNRIVEKHWATRNPEIAIKLIDDADDDTKLKLYEWQLQREEAIVASWQESADIDLPCPENLDYMPFQKAGISYALNRNGVILGDEMGTGKTIQTLGVINADESIKNVLVICPATLKINWVREAKKWLLREFTYAIPRTKPRKRFREVRDSITPEVNFVVVNYELLNQFKEIMSRQWDLLVVDEFHYIKETTSQRTKAVLGYWNKKLKERVDGIIDNCRRKMFLSGTPMKNRPIEIFPVASKLNPVDFGNWKKFVTRYCNGHMVPAGRTLVWDTNGSSNLDELDEKLRATIMIRRLKADVMKELPPKTRQLVTLSADGLEKLLKEEQAIMDEIRVKLNTQLALLEEFGDDQDNDNYHNAVRALTSLKLTAIDRMSKIRHDTAVAKVPVVIKHIEDALESSDKVVCFAHHHDVVHALKDHFGDIAVVLTGEQNLNQKQNAVDRFQDDTRIRLFIGSITAAGVGITLTASSHVIFAELAWVPGDISQAEDRCHRKGQTDNVLVQHLVIDESIDATLAQMIVDKQEVLDAALDDKDRLAKAEDEISMLEGLLGMKKKEACLC